jgi:3-phenylpropionate/trans-cinnamate dioxygenase ferredoxin reductase subunit
MTDAAAVSAAVSVDASVDASVAPGAAPARIVAAHPGTVVVIGGGQAAGWVVKTLRKDGYSGRLVMIAEESHQPYERPPLSKAVLAGEADIDTVRLISADAFAELNVECWQPDCAVAIDRASRTVRTASGRELVYDKLVIATGGAARQLPAALAQTRNLAYLRTLDDAMALRKRLQASRSVLVIGGGWIGLEVAATARKLGLAVTVLEGAPRLCARSVPPVISDFLAELHRAHGVDLRIGVSLTGLADHPEDRNRVRATLADGSTVDADFAVAGIGLAPNTALAVSAGLEVADGIVVDAYGRSSDPDIYACGDVANHPNTWLQRRVRLESWANAQNQAIVAAHALLGETAAYAEIPWFWSDQYDVNLQILGDVPADAASALASGATPGTAPVLRGDLAARQAALFFLADARVRGVIAINAARDLKLARKWMNQGRTVDAASLSDAAKALA